MRFEMKACKGADANASDSLLINGQPGDLLPCSKSVVGTDGSYTKPLTRDYITIFPGQTFDVLLEANQRPDHYYMAAKTFSDAPEVVIFLITQPPQLLYSTGDTTLHLHLPSCLIYLHSMTQLHRFRANGTRSAASINNISFHTPTIDILEAYYYNISVAERRNRSKGLEYNSTVEIVLQGTNLVAGVTHPMHLHGHSFYVVGWGFGNFDENRDPMHYNLVDPPHQNTISVPKNGWVAIRFEAPTLECGSCTAI
ncbi:Laccase-14 [Vitis vinifera]|uniref:Laccase-14 n=1 Tax=Vitis vinifera TaxID=29760 RepID=A0A438JDQ5_VITVI|nr:Laccase-14 [Vitis vinifera]